ncbi:autotransporter outer membrane beta-barrel domain-containing protein, partial [Helicobacter sp. 11S03491-1]|uniref:autotransporter outer membrane beta-barrel domain-containing protein n=1 Tax=Helicobacter sp. 11S03491-1 TaxID=1476196 RepID=UPI00117A945D
YTPRTLSVNTITGENGVFRLMADVRAGTTDTISANNVNGAQYIQIYQNPSHISLDVAGKNMVVASAATLGVNGGFEGIATIIGLYDYLPILQQTNTAGGRINWVLAGITQTPNQTAKSLFNILSLPYKTFRIHADNLYYRMDDLLYPPTLNGLWAKVYAGGIYQKQPSKDKTTQDLFYSFQGGYDKGENFGEKRYFYGFSLDYTRLNTGDKGYKGYVHSIDIGGYGGYLDENGWDISGSMQYGYSYNHTQLYQADDPFNFGGHFFLLSMRVGYRFYPFYKIKTRIIEKCVRPTFCRNGIEDLRIRDESFYFQPYVSLTPGFILGEKISFSDKQSRSHISAKLHASPALISKIGLLTLKRYDYPNQALNLRALIEYSHDLNLGGKITLTDDVDMPLNRSVQMDNRLGIGIGGDYLLLNDSLKFYGDFKTEFFGKLNTYWLVSAGIRYKFGQKPPKTYKSLNYRPQVNQTQKARPKNVFKPYESIPSPKSDSFYQNNHY